MNINYEKYLNENIPNHFKKKIQNTTTLENTLAKIMELSEKIYYISTESTEWDVIKNNLNININDLKIMVDNCHEYINKNK